MAGKPGNNVYRKVAIENSYAVEEQPDGSKKIIYQPIIYINSTSERNLTIIEFSQTAMGYGTHNINASAKDNSNVSNGILFSEQPPLTGQDAAAAINNSLPELLKNIEQEEMNISAEALRNYNNLSAQMTDANKSMPNKEFLVTNFNALNNYASSELQNGNKSHDVIRTNGETTAPDVNIPQMSSNELIQIYCSKCRKVPSNQYITDSNCCMCQSLLEFQCMNCFQLFESCALVKKHIELECKNESIYKCLTCDFGTDYKSTYERHIKGHILERNALYSYKMKNTNKLERKSAPSTHGKPKSESCCPYCPKRIKNDKMLTAHLFQKHQDRLPDDYKCHICEKKYKCSMSLMGHLTRLHRVGLNSKNALKQEVKFYQCACCNKKLGSKRDLTKHLKKCT